jgi:hypothetical protein
MLPSTAVGTVEFRSLLEPVRVANPFVNYFEAECDRIDVQEKVGRGRLLGWLPEVAQAAQHPGQPALPGGLQAQLAPRLPNSHAPAPQRRRRSAAASARAGGLLHGRDGVQGRAAGGV